MGFSKFAAAGLAAVTAVAFSGMAEATNLRMLSSWTPANKGTYLSETTFMRLVEEVSNKSMKVTRAGPEVVPPFEQVQPVVAGVFDILMTHGAYHPGTTAMGMALDVVDGDPEKRRSTGIWDEADKHYQTLGLKALAFVPQGRSGYHMILRNPIGESGDIKGRRIRGTVTYHPLIQALGGSPVVLPGGQVYSALERGVVDGACWPTLGALDLKWHEVAKYYVRPSFGVSTLLVFMNLKKFNALPAEQQKILLEAGRQLELEVFKEFDKLAEEERLGLEKNGMRETRFSPENEAKISGAFEEGVWSLVEGKNGDEARALRKLVQEKNMGL